MYGLPTDLDLRFLIGPTLLQVCFGQNEAILRFEKEISITLESRFLVHSPGGQGIAFERAPAAAASLVEFLSDCISDVSSHPNGTLRLAFAGGGILELYDSSETSESYQIHHGKEIFVV